jgi:hypothetical protein
VEIPIDYQLIHQVDKATSNPKFKWQAFDDHRIEVENGS